MPSPAALPRKKGLEEASFQEHRGKQLDKRRHSSWDPSWVGDRNGLHCSHILLKGARKEYALNKPSLEPAAVILPGPSLPLTFRPLCPPQTLHQSVLATAVKLRFGTDRLHRGPPPAPHRPSAQTALLPPCGDRKHLTGGRDLGALGEKADGTPGSGEKGSRTGGSWP